LGEEGFNRVIDWTGLDIRHQIVEAGFQGFSETWRDVIISDVCGNGTVFLGGEGKDARLRHRASVRNGFLKDLIDVVNFEWVQGCLDPGMSWKRRFLKQQRFGIIKRFRFLVFDNPSSNDSSFEANNRHEVSGPQYLRTPNI
jgi:hypothetical protein